MSEAPLAGVRILDLSRLLPGPFCTMLLADLGAEVIKVEAPGAGDYARTLVADFGGPAMFSVVNRNKRGLALDYRHPHGRDLLLRLAAHSDVFVETFRPGAVSRWGIDYAALRAANQRIVYCSLSGYGQAGPYRDRAGHDLNYIAVGGLLDLNGQAGGPPVPPGVQIADLAGGMLAALSIMSALLGRGATGDGRYLDVSMLDAIASWMAPLAGSLNVAWHNDHTVARGRIPLSGTLPCYNVYACADGSYVALSALEPHFWGAFCQTAGCADLLDSRLDPSAVPRVASLLGGRPRAEWLAMFENVDACFEPVNDLQEMLAHPQVRYRGLAGEDGQVFTPFRFVAESQAPLPAPRLGEHTREVLREVGVSDAEIDRLAAERVIGLGEG